MGRVDAARLPLLGEGQPLPHAHEAAATPEAAREAADGAGPAAGPEAGTCPVAAPAPLQVRAEAPRRHAGGVRPEGAGRGGGARSPLARRRRVRGARAPRRRARLVGPARRTGAAREDHRLGLPADARGSVAHRPFVREARRLESWCARIEHAYGSNVRGWVYFNNDPAAAAPRDAAAFRRIARRGGLHVPGPRELAPTH